MKAKFLVKTSYKPVSPYAGTDAIREDLLKDGFAVVMDNDTLKGILTTEDIIKSPYNLVLDCLRERPIIDHEQSVDAILDQMKASDFTCLPVFRENNFIGVIQHSDIINYLSEYRCELENKVKAHTAELSEINKKLVKEIADKQKAEKENRDLLEKVYHAQKAMAIGTLAGGIAHDFNNILSPIIGFTELALFDVEEGSPLWLKLKEIYNAGMRAKDLAGQILTYARQTSQIAEPIQPAEIMQEGIKLIRSTIPKSIKIRQDIGTEAFIKADPTKILQIYMNLCMNAYHSMEKTGGIMGIRLSEVNFQTDQSDLPEGILPGKYVIISVSDTGTGILPEILNRIFDPYFTTKGVGRGTGMGLAVTEGIVKGYNGAITVDSKLGKGSTFSVYLPVSNQDPIKKPLVDESIPKGTEKILFIDDEPAIVRLNQLTLEYLGYQVKTKTNPLEALELFKSKPDYFDLVITDMTMAELNGDMLSVELLKIRPDIPIILCTGYSSIITDKKAFEKGIKAFLYKPVSEMDLAKTIRNLLDKKVE